MDVIEHAYSVQHLRYSPSLGSFCYLCTRLMGKSNNGTDALTATISSFGKKVFFLPFYVSIFRSALFAVWLFFGFCSQIEMKPHRTVYNMCKYVFYMYTVCMGAKQGSAKERNEDVELNKNWIAIKMFSTRHKHSSRKLDLCFSWLFIALRGSFLRVLLLLLLFCMFLCRRVSVICTHVQIRYIQICGLIQFLFAWNRTMEKNKYFCWAK